MKIRMLALAAAVGMLQVACDADRDGLKNKEEKKLGLDPKAEDSDGDGMLDGEEVEAGSDPLNPDTDADRLSDGDEVTNKTDPTNPDTDGDGYLDGDEVAEGSDPADPNSLIYKGHWPYWYDKDSLGNKSFDHTGLSAGDKLPRHIAKDQNKDLVDMYDFAGPEQTYEFIAVDTSAEWCGPCQVVSLWLSGGPDYYELEPDYGDLRAAINDGSFQWITVLTQDNAGDPPGVQVLKSWDDQFPNEMIPVMADNDYELEDGIVMVYGGWPSGVLLKADTMKIKFIGSIYDVMDESLAKL